MRAIRPWIWELALLAGGITDPVLAQTASPMTRPPRFPDAVTFSAQSAPASAKQHASMVHIPGGNYLIGSPAPHPLANRAAMPEHRVAIKPFRIDRAEVTNAQFAEFLNALPVRPIGTALGGRTRPENFAPQDRRLFLEFSSRPSPYTIIDTDDEDARIGVRNGRFAPNAGHDDHPVTETTWAGALAYCRWRGGRLPTEVEWEAAARGTTGRAFPLGRCAAESRTRGHRTAERDDGAGRQPAEGRDARWAARHGGKPAGMDQYARSSLPVPRR